MRQSQQARRRTTAEEAAEGADSHHADEHDEHLGRPEQPTDELSRDWCGKSAAETTLLAKEPAVCGHVG